MGLRALFLAIPALLAVSSARADLQFCNKTSYVLDLALALEEKDAAARRGRVLFLERQREIEYVAGLVAELEVGARGRGHAEEDQQAKDERARLHRAPHRRIAN